MARNVIIERRSGWWAARSLREKRLLMAMAALLALVIIWFALIRPLSDARAAAEQRLNANVTELARARAEAAMARQLNAATSNQPVPLPVDGFLMQSGGEQGFAGLQVTGQGASRATINLGNVRPQAFFGWIAQLETRGLVVESMSARANSDQTVAVQAALRAGGG